jgi:hypothetical protein
MFLFLLVVFGILLYPSQSNSYSFSDISLMESFPLNPAQDVQHAPLLSGHFEYSHVLPWSNHLKGNTEPDEGASILMEAKQGNMLEKGRLSPTNQSTPGPSVQADEPRPLDLSHISSIQLSWLLGASVFGLMGFSRKPC